MDSEIEENSPFSLETNAAVVVHAGFPNAAAFVPVAALNFNQLLITHPTSTFCFRIAGDHWEGQGVFNGDIAVVNRALSPRQTDMVVSWDQEEFILLPFFRIGTHDPWGVVTSIIHEYRSSESQNRPC
jgi:SOS-response transcriptional repressor LexA